MSEPNSPLKPQAESGLESSLEWWNPFPELTETETVNEQSIDPQAIAPLEHCEAMDTSQNPQQNSQEVGAASQDLPEIVPITPAEPPNLIDLISLIQELNQCNGVLLDRVSQLEEALERSQQALQGQVGRSPESLLSVQTEDPANAQAQIANLFSQLEFAHQTNQRQHILIETLTAELENSQERAAQLEREAALLQQRYSEQTQLLVQSEGTCRDLQARLQRQQRYTLQFKAALEKCLEMPVPQTEAGAETIAPPIDSLLLPKAQQIQPWSRSSVPQESLLPWMKRFKNATGGVLPDVEQETSEVEALLSEIAPVEEINAVQEPVQPRVNAVQLPVLAPPHLTTEQPAEPPTPSATEIPPQPDELLMAETPSTPSISYDLKPQAGAQSGILSPPLLNQIDAVVQPLADRLAEVFLAQATPADSLESEPVQDVPAQALQSESLSDEPADEADSVIITDPDSLLASAMSEAEDALWQDLARLIEVSPEEAVRASLTGDLAAFESLNFESLNFESFNSELLNSESIVPQIEPHPVVPPPNGEGNEAAPPQSIAQNPPASVPPQPQAEPLHNQILDRPATTPAMQDAGAKAKAVAAQLPFSAQNLPEKPVTPTPAANLSSPAPLLNPLRPTAKKRSLSSVELPSFLRQEDSKPLPT